MVVIIYFIVRFTFRHFSKELLVDNMALHTRFEIKLYKKI